MDSYVSDTEQRKVSTGSWRAWLGAADRDGETADLPNMVVREPDGHETPSTDSRIIGGATTQVDRHTELPWRTTT